MDLPGFPANLARQAKLASLAPLEAARALLDGDFGIAEETPLCFAILRDDRITLDEDAIMEILFDMFEEVGRDERIPGDRIPAEAFLDRLAGASQRPPNRRR